MLDGGDWLVWYVCGLRSLHSVYVLAFDDDKSPVYIYLVTTNRRFVPARKSCDFFFRLFSEILGDFSGSHNSIGGLDYIGSGTGSIYHENDKAKKFLRD